MAEARFAAWGTGVQVLVAGEGDRLGRARRAVQAELDAVDRACSRFRSDSQLARVNAAAGRPVPVGPVLAEALSVALRAAAVSDGDVDPTVGQALRLAGYDRDFAALPRRAGPVRLAAIPVAGWGVVELDRTSETVRVPAGVSLDLGATAKGWAADRCARAAWRASAAGVLVSLGGDVAVAGPAPEGAWRVRVTDDHRAPSDAPGQTVTIVSGGLATSSTTVRRWRRGAQTMHHIFDPRTGEPAASGWRTVSVAAGSCVDANTAATAAIVRGRRAVGWLEELGLPARLVASDGSVTRVAGWPVEEAA